MIGFFYGFLEGNGVEEGVVGKYGVQGENDRGERIRGVCFREE